jgi:hypothetical protein
MHSRSGAYMTAVAAARSASIPRVLSLRRPAFADVGAWSFAVALVAYLGLRNGGFDAVVRQEVGVATNWILLCGAAAGILAPLRASRSAVAAWGLLGLLAIWTAASWSWSESDERTADEVGRIATYIGVFGVALAIATAGRARQLANGLATGVLAIVGIAVLSRLLPDAFPTNVTGQFLPGIEIEERLAYPLNYSSGLGAFAAFAVPLALWLAHDARTIVGAALAAAALPVAGLCIYLTSSGGAVMVAAATVFAYLVLTSDRLPQLVTVAVAAVATAVLAQAVDRHPAVDRGLQTAAAEDQGREVLLLVLIVTVGAAFLQTALTLSRRYGRRPAWSVVSRKQATAATLAVLAVGAVLAGAAGLPATLEDRWDAFKDRGQAAGVTDSRASQLFSVSSSGRYDFWTVAADAAAEKPWTGIGAGTWDLYWARHNTYEAYVRDSHSVYFDALAELGYPGLGLVILFIGGSLVLGVIAVLRGPAHRRPMAAGAVAAGIAFSLGAALDWLWELAVLPVAFVIALAIALGKGATSTAAPSRAPRIATAVVAAIALVAVVVPLAGDAAVQDSQAAFRASNLQTALDSAARAERVESYAAGPLLQQALIYEAAADYDAAASRARAAARLEPTNWRPWFILARVEAERGEARAAVDALRRARAVRPTSSVLAGG